MSKERLDVLLVDRGLVESRSQAQRLVMAGQVRVDGQLMLKPATQVFTNANLEIERGPRFVSRGGEKLTAALEAFSIDVNGWVCADVGASTGGFTDCLLQNGAARVYAIDVGKGILHWKIRKNPRVVVMEETNARYIQRLPEALNLATIDASFISLKILLPVVRGWFADNPILESMTSRLGDERQHIVALIKPQFEAGRREASRGHGVIRDAAVHRQVLEDILNFATEHGFCIRGVIQSPLLGPKGNTEFLAWLSYPVENPEIETSFNLDEIISQEIE